VRGICPQLNHQAHKDKLYRPSRLYRTPVEGPIWPVSYFVRAPGSLRRLGTQSKSVKTVDLSQSALSAGAERSDRRATESSHAQPCPLRAACCSRRHLGRCGSSCAGSMHGGVHVRRAAASMDGGVVRRGAEGGDPRAIGWGRARELQSPKGASGAPRRHQHGKHHTYEQGARGASEAGGRGRRGNGGKAVALAAPYTTRALPLQRAIY